MTALATNQLPPDGDRNREILDVALTAFIDATGIPARCLATEQHITPGGNADTLIEFGEAERRTPPFIATVKTINRATALAAIKERLAPGDARLILVTPYLTAELANQCRKLDLPFLDTAGNAYLHTPDLYVFIKGEKRPELAPAVGTRGAGTATALRVIFALLCRPELLVAPYRRIVETTGVALGAVGWVYFDLQHRGHLIGGQRNRHFVEPKRLLEEWVTNYPIKLRPKLNPRRFRAPTKDWWKTCELPAGAYWGGEVAANLLTNHLKPAFCTIYVDPNADREAVARIAGMNRLRADPDGDVEILQMFWHFEHKQAQEKVVPPLLVYADLLATLDPRNLEVATMIRERHFENALR